MSDDGPERVVAKRVLLSVRERSLSKSPWPSVNRALALQWFLTAILPFVALAFMIAPLDAPLCLVVIATLILTAGLLLVLWAARRAWTVYVRELVLTPSAAEPDDWEIDAERIQVSSDSMRAQARWRAFADVRETDEVIHFILSPAQIWALPKRFLSEPELAKLRRLIDAARSRGDLKGIPD